LATEYPFNTRKIQFDYGSITEQSRRMGRVRTLASPTQGSLATYQYAGLDRTVKLTYVTPGIDLSTISPDGAPGDDARDPFLLCQGYGGRHTGWDRFGCTQDSRTRPKLPRPPRLRVRLSSISVSIRVDPWFSPSSSPPVFHCSLLTDHSALPPTLTQIGGSSSLLDHDSAGNMTLCPPAADGDWDEALTLVWDVWNRLTEVRSADGTTLVAKYTYDGLWRRTTRQIGTGPVIHTYYNAQWRPLQETEDDGTTVTLARTLARTYDWGLRYRDDLIRRINHLDDDATHYALHDYYNVTAIVGSTNSGSSESSSGSSVGVLERYGYSAFGDVRFMTAAYVTKPTSDHAWDLLYKAQFRDEETGFYNYGFRCYSPMLGRWLSRDPIGEEGGLNLYGFVGNNGVNGTDHLGLIKWTTNIKNELINPETDKIIRNNCLGYALYGKDGIFVTPVTDGTEALGPALQRSGWDCTMVKQKSDCSCECSDDKILIAVTQNDNPTNLGKNPFTNKDFDWTEKINGKYVTEFHAIRAITGCSNRYKEVPGANNNIQDQGKVTDPYFDGRYDLLCCCLNKPKD
jgi:RHS repeat-associated protein